MAHWFLKEIINYYLGAKFRYEYEAGKSFIATIQVCNDIGYLCGDDESGEWFEVDNWGMDGKFELLLHDPKEMDEIQKAQYYALCLKVYDSNQVQYYTMDTPASLHFLFRNQIDAFGLIDKGLAININKMHTIL